MHILILGAAGMLGRKLAERLARDVTLGGRTVDRLTLVDVVKPTVPAGFAGLCECLAVDLASEGAASGLATRRPELIFHLAAIVSGEAEADLEIGYRVNLDGTRALLDAIRIEGGSGWRPRVVFSSSNAVYGGTVPDVIDDTFVVTPQTSYGTQKAMGEQLLADYSRRGILDGIGLRLPTICVRPGKPNRAASSFFSGIIREPLAGQEAILPVADTLRHWFTSPRSAIGFLIHAATLDLARLGDRPNLNMPGLSATVAEQIEALRRVAGDKAVALIRSEPDPAVERIVSGWARAFDPARARALGFTAETRFDDIIRAHVEDELGGTIA
ncbi:SDR family oxidoreductase [Lichenicola cladoniae]|uniref:SDR family oxidoreductase n=1 Tax=Lichenicola cladoniae TaxID=1484109 RepID=A0A6M8HSK0_9PROT|nr:D-erythronate dehydrogenase [Lichenicola cladoniae]NPD65802.1 SDR family oxidoreductase [Acetobacteraceae bacterium]QKE91187.1 SDR family oxidoreductase [Lichenicola cladoniae]